MLSGINNWILITSVIFTLYIHIWVLLLHQQQQQPTTNQELCRWFLSLPVTDVFLPNHTSLPDLTLYTLHLLHYQSETNTIIVQHSSLITWSFLNPGTSTDTLPLLLMKFEKRENTSPNCAHREEELRSVTSWTWWRHFTEGGRDLAWIQISRHARHVVISITVFELEFILLLKNNRMREQPAGI